MGESRIKGEHTHEALTSFVNLLTGDEYAKLGIEGLVVEIGKYYQADRSYIYETDEAGENFCNIVEWAEDGVNSDQYYYPKVPCDHLQIWIDKFHESGNFFLKNDEEFHKNHYAVAKELDKQNVVTLMAAPITLDGSIAGFLGLDNPRANTEKLVLMSVMAAGIYKEIVHGRESQLIKKLKIAQGDVENINSVLKESGIGCWTLRDLDRVPKLHPNLEMKVLLGIEYQDLSDEEVYRFWKSRLNPEDQKNLDDFVEKTMNGGFSEVTYLWNHPTRGMIYVRCNGTVQIDEDGSSFFQGIHADVTSVVKKEQEAKHNLEKLNQELEVAKKEAEASANAKSTFLFNMSHDIRTPMNAILGFSHLMEKEKNNPVLISDYLKKIQDSGEYLLNLINNVLDMARIESGKVELDKNFVDIEAESKGPLDICSAEINRKGLKFTHDINVQNRYVMGDSAKLQQISVNLVSNAVKYTPEGGSIHISLLEVPCERKGYARIQNRVSDTGIGMSKEFQEHIFEAFTREKNSTESKVIGTGLGMSITKKLVDLMGGTIELESELGKGTTFTVTLDFEIANEPEKYLEKRKEVTVDKKLFSAKRILLAEDNDLNAEIAIAIFEDNGLCVDRAVDGVDCINILDKAAPGFYDVILMDVQMPKMDGYQATKNIRGMNSDAKKHIPIIAMTANAFEEDKKKAIEMGMNGHISKPINIGDLMEMLTKIFEQS